MEFIVRFTVDIPQLNRIGDIMERLEGVLQAIVEELNELQGLIHAGMTEAEAEQIKTAIRSMSDQLQQPPPPPPPPDEQP